MIRQAVILAGGKGTRLQSRLNGLPKPLVDVEGVPLLERQIVLLRDSGFDDLVVLVNHRADAIEAFCREKKNWGLKIRLVDDGERGASGTAGAVLAILDTLAPEFAVVYGDTLLDVDFSRFEAFHAADPAAAATLFLHPNDHPHDSDLVEADAAGRIEAFHPYPHPEGAWLPNLVNAALYLVRRDALAPWKDAAPPLDFAKDLFPRMLAAGQGLRGYNSPEYIKDAGTPDRLDKACAALRSGAVARASLRHPQKAVFLDRDGTLNDDPGHIATPEQMRVFPFAGPALRRLNDAGWRAVLVTNQPVLARGEATEAGLRRIHARLESDLARPPSKAFLDRIYFCPHHPDKGFPGEVAALKIDCGCRKPLPGMLLRARADLNIDLAESWLIGDSTADLAAAAAAGVASILVETGQAGLDDKCPAEPDFVRPDLAAAVAFILDAYPALAARLAPLAARIGAGESWFVGGLSRSGKSTAASALRRELRRAGRDAVVVRLDRWLLDRDRRGPGVLGRYEMAAVEALFARVAARGADAVEIAPPYYSRKRRARLPGAPLRIPGGAAVIWEGVVAGELARRTGGTARFVQVEGGEDARRRRVLREYALRGDGTDGERLYNEREADEHEPVRKWGEEAALRLSLDDLLEPHTEATP